MPIKSEICVFGGGDCASDQKLVLLHGLGATVDQFEVLLDFVDQGIFVAAITLPGHDRNIPISSGRKPGFQVFCDQVIELCDAHDIRSAVFCGISMGGAIALMIAAKRPDLCRSVVVSRPAWLTEVRPENLLLIGLIGGLFREGTADQVLARLEATPEFVEIAKDVPAAAQSLRSVVTRPYAKRHAPTLTAMFQDAPFRRLAELRNVRCPVVVIGTNADPLHPIELAHQTANALPNAQLEILPPRYLEPAAHADAFKAVVRAALDLSHGDENDHQES